MQPWRQTLYYKLFLWGALGLSLLLLYPLATTALLDARVVGVDDFVQYWAAGRLNALGGNPYDPEQLRPLQRASGGAAFIESVATIAWNPPWTLALLMPFGLLSYPLSRLLWFLLHFALLFVTVCKIWDLYDGAAGERWVAWITLFILIPTLFVLKKGQIGALLLAGLVGALAAARRERWWLVGVCLTLLTIKPQLPYLFWPALLLWSVTQQKVSLALGGIGAVTFLTAVALVANPAVLQQYYTAVTTYPPAQWATPTLGGALRLLFGVEHFWLQFVPPLAGCVWLAFYWFKRRRRWDWVQESPLLLTVSLVTAAYAWTYDLVLLALPAVQVGALASRRARSWQMPVVALYAALNGVILLMQRWVHNDLWFMWVAPAFLGWYLWAIWGNIDAFAEINVV